MPGRKPIHLELTGGKSKRQRIWEKIRKTGGKDFCLDDVRPCGVPEGTAREYLIGLTNANYLMLVKAGGKSHPRDKTIWALVIDSGAEAPRVRKDGSEVTQGRGNEAVWGAMQALGSFNTRVLAEMAGVKPNTVKAYCIALHAAGYLAEEREGKGVGRGGILAQYRLLKSKVTGPRPPMITRLKAVYDPNVHKIVWQQGADEALEAAEAV